MIHDTSLCYDDFFKVDIRVGTVTNAEQFPEARKPAYKLIIDFGSEIGLRKSSAQITDHYTCEELIGKQVLCVINFPKKQVGPFLSEVLTLGVSGEQGHIVLLGVDTKVANGSRVH